MKSPWQKRRLRLRQDERGGVLIMVCLGLVALLGFAAIVTDYGAVALERRRLVNAADAAVLAAAQELLHNPEYPASAEARAREYAGYNGVAPDRTVVFVSPAENTITVTVENEVSYLFAQVFGETGRNVTARAKALVGPAGGLSGIAPFSIVEQELNYGVEYNLKYSTWQESGLSPGNFGALALGGTGANRYRNNIKNGYLSSVSTGDILDTEEGNMAGPTTQGLKDLLATNCGCTLENYQPGCPLLIYIPIIRMVTHNKVEVVGFAAFFIDREAYENNADLEDGDVVGTFVEKTMDLGQVDQSLEPYGVYAVNLVE